MLMSKSRLEKFLYALYSLDSSDLPTPLSRIEELYKCLVTGEEPPTFEPLSRVEKYLMAILGVYDVDSLPNPLSRVEVLLYKLATGDDNLDDVKSFLSEHEELLAEIIRNGGVGGNIDIEYVLYTLSMESNTLYNTAEKPIKSAILKGNTDENLQSVKMPVLTTTGKNLISKWYDGKMINDNGELIIRKEQIGTDFILIETKGDFVCESLNSGTVRLFNVNKQLIGKLSNVNKTFNVTNQVKYITFNYYKEVIPSFLQLEKGSIATEYEPYKSNILTVNEDVELRGIGDVKDELDLVTGELTERIGEVVLDGSEDWSDADNALSNTHRFQVSLSTFKSGGIMLNDGGFDTITFGTSYTDTKNIQISGEYAFIRTLRNEVDSLDDLKSFLSSNPLTIIGELAVGTTSKTVDISVVDQDGSNTKLSTFNDITYVTLSSEGFIPEAELEVATKNEEVLNTMSFEMDDISTTQNDLQETLDTQSENADATMIATTEIYEGLL